MPTYEPAETKKKFKLYKPPAIAKKWMSQKEMLLAMIQEDPEEAAEMQVEILYDLAGIMTEVNQSLAQFNRSAAYIFPQGAGTKAFPDQIVHQLITLQPGQSGMVWQFNDIPDGKEALLRYLGVKWFQNTNYSFQIDGIEIENITRTIGSMSNPIGDPYKFDKPYVATVSISFYATNNDTVAHIFEVYANGEIIPSPSQKKSARSGL